MEVGTDAHGHTAYDVRWEGRLRFDEPFLIEAMVNTARLWSTLHPSASSETRERLVRHVAEALDVDMG
ncbi:hypothetical protein [Kozakia baliensis]|uniref:hypothetical protein n=1 Tax=Kozakia baliensis TaxID=153496 RepID=UPI00049587E0|nr:hypothetical protein [Kozakia baliensis]